MVYWDINQTNLYFDSFYKLPLGRQQEILRRWLKIADCEDLTTSFLMTSCPIVGLNYFLVNFDDLELEFLIQVLRDERVIKLISLGKPTRFDYHQHD